MYLVFFFPAGTKVEMPSLSPTMEFGTIVKWMKQEGNNNNNDNLSFL